VIINWKSHGRSPVHSLISAIYGYAVPLFRHNTTLAMTAEVCAWVDRQGGFTFSAAGEFKNEVLGLMHAEAKPSMSQSEFEAMVAHSRVFKQLPDAKRKAIKGPEWKM
jgi:hypothetical protein